MMQEQSTPLLAADEPPAFRVIHAGAASPFVITCEHASARIPRKLRSLGLAPADLARHIAFDLGAAQVTSELAARLESWAILQNYSRLVIDCNRPLVAPDSIVTISDGTPIPGNQSLSHPEIRQRQSEIFQPHHDCIAAELDRRQRSALPAIVVAIHSFTPALTNGGARPWHAGVLYNRDDRVARVALRGLRALSGGAIGDNEPYSVSDESDFTIPVHGEQRGLPHVEIELRQDLLATEVDRSLWVERLAEVLLQAHAQIRSGSHA